MDTCPLCFKTVAPAEPNSTKLQDYLRDREVSSRQMERLGGRNPRVHRVCVGQMPLVTEEIVLRVVRQIPRPTVTRTSVAVPAIS